MAFAADTFELESFLDRTFRDGKASVATFTRPVARDAQMIGELKRLASIPVNSHKPRSGGVRSRLRGKDILITIATQPTARGEQVQLRTVTI